MAFLVQECTFALQQYRFRHPVHTALRKEPDFWRAASVPDAWCRRRQRGTEWEQERQLQARRYTQEVAATRRWLREATQLLRKTK
jgi:hypothetical protein